MLNREPMKLLQQWLQALARLTFWQMTLARLFWTSCSLSLVKAGTFYAEDAADCSLWQLVGQQAMSPRM